MKALPLLIFLGLAACTDRAPEAVSETPRNEAPRNPSVFDPMISTIGRAEGVEQTLQNSEADRRRQLEEAEGR
jgi:hypothetical protein